MAKVINDTAFPVKRKPGRPKRIDASIPADIESAPQIRKTGPVSAETRKFILDNQTKFTVEELAQKCGATTERVREIIDVYGTLPATSNLWAQRLRSSATWKQLQKEFNEEELDFFVESYQLFMAQFKEDVLPTEEKQIFQMIKLDILMHRNLAARQTSGQIIRQNQQMIDSIVDRAGGDMSLVTREDQNIIRNCHQNISNARGSEQSRTNEYAILHKEYGNLMEQLKATRNQRVHNIQNNKKTFPDMVQDLLDRDRQIAESRQEELFKMAVVKERERLSKPHKYMNGEIDLPILSAETLEELDKQESEEPNGNGQI